MTNQDLLDLLVQRMPEDLSEDELQLLRDRLRDDASFRALVVDELQMGSYVETALARLGTDLKSLQPPPPKRALSFKSLAGAMLFLVAMFGLVFGGAALVDSFRKPPEMANVEPSPEVPVIEVPSEEPMPGETETMPPSGPAAKP